MSKKETITRGNVLKLPTFDERSRATGSRFGGLRLYRTGEGDQVTASTPKYRSVDLHLNKLTGTTFATSDLFEDVPALRTVLARTFKMEAATVVDDEIIDVYLTIDVTLWVKTERRRQDECHRSPTSP
jgi:HK97 family phage major capsid protein